jgi:hypothetical protein
VALATSVLIGDYLDAGRLVRPFPHEVRGAYQYYIVCPEASAEKPDIVAFRTWLLAEAAAHAKRRPGLDASRRREGAAGELPPRRHGGARICARRTASCRPEQGSGST